MKILDFFSKRKTDKSIDKSEALKEEPFVFESYTKEEDAVFYFVRKDFSLQMEELKEIYLSDRVSLCALKEDEIEVSLIHPETGQVLFKAGVSSFDNDKTLEETINEIEAIYLNK